MFTGFHTDFVKRACRVLEGLWRGFHGIDAEKKL